MESKDISNEELRLKIAAALGWTQIDNSRPGFAGPWAVQPGADGEHAGDWSPLPNWPINIAEAWALVEELQLLYAKRGYWFALVGPTLFVNESHPCFKKWSVDKWGYTKKDGEFCAGFEAADTAPRAICLAWLASTSKGAGRGE